MLTSEEKDIIQQTVPVLQKQGTEITQTFYNRMFNQHPELRNMFNQTNQKRGFQSTALAQSVLAAAVNIDDLSKILPVVKEIGYKHCALQVFPEHYPIVGENLLAAIQEVVGLEESHPIIQTWGKAYGEIADAFIQVEKEIYDSMIWDGFKPFKITSIEEERSNIKVFTVDTNGIDLSQYVPGQYITVDVNSTKLPYRAKRHYSVVEGTQDSLKFAVKRHVENDMEGEVSAILHDEFSVGDDILLSAPVGGFKVHNPENDQLFIGSGIGTTPLIPMFKQATSESQDVKFIQVADKEGESPFEQDLKEIAEQGNAKLHIHDKSVEGYLLKDELKDYLEANTEIYVCGGTVFIQTIVKELKALHVDMTKVHFETFVPRLSVEV